MTEIGNSPIQPPTGAGAGTQEATNFRVVVTVNGDIPGVRPGFTCTAEITTAMRTASLAVPIQATTVREVEVNAAGTVVRRTDDTASGVLSRTAAAASSSPPVGGEVTREEREGVFVVRQGRAVFVPVATGIAGERYFEALSGLQEGDLVITGPFEIVRNLDDGDPVAPNETDSDS